MPRSAGLECQAEKLGQLAAVWRCLVLAVGGLKGSSLCVRVCEFPPTPKVVSLSEVWGQFMAPGCPCAASPSPPPPWLSGSQLNFMWGI